MLPQPRVAEAEAVPAAEWLPPQLVGELVSDADGGRMGSDPLHADGRRAASHAGLRGHIGAFLLLGLPGVHLPGVHLPCPGMWSMESLGMACIVAWPPHDARRRHRCQRDHPRGYAKGYADR